MTIFFRPFVWLGVVVFLGSAVGVRANLLVNGSFENPGSAVTTTYANVAGSSAFTNAGWYAVAGNGNSPAVYYAASNGGASWIPNAQSGNYCVQLDSTQDTNFTVGSSVSQTFNIAQAGSYRLSFWINTEVGGGKGGTSGTDVILVSGVGRSVLNGVEYVVTNPANVDRAVAQWLNYTVDFTVGANQTGNYKLTFTDSPNSALNNYPRTNVSLDNVSVDLVPEFSHWAVGALVGTLPPAWSALRRWHQRRRATGTTGGKLA